MTMNENKPKCIIWPEYHAEHHQNDVPLRATIVHNSPRAGGSYKIINIVARRLERDDLIRAKLTTLLVNARENGDECPLVTADLIKTARAKQPLSVNESANRLLRYLESITTELGEWKSPTREGIQHMMAISETTSDGEAVFLMKSLADRNFIDFQELYAPSLGHFRITLDGYNYIADLVVNPDSAQCFIAMWFDESMNDAYEQGIKTAIEAAGYNPIRIDKKDDNLNKIDDQIIAEIRRSRFLVADFTHGDDGARGGVYYEAGFAHGLNIPVIFMCREDKLEELHFDTRQYPHIVWEKPNDLCGQLQQRILAAIGEGPNIATTL